MNEMKKDRCGWPIDFNVLCRECGLSGQGVLFKSAFTVSEGTCPCCKKEKVTLIPIRDFRWPRPKSPDKTAGANGDEEKGEK